MPLRATYRGKNVEGNHPMMRIQQSIGALLVAGSLSLGFVGPATAQVQSQDGLVNVAVGDVTIAEDVNIGVAAQTAAALCGLKIGPVAVLGTAVDRSGTPATVCTTPQGPVTIEQN